MKIIEIYEPPLCCPTGVCGPVPVPALIGFQDAILRLKKEGHEIERIAINQQPMRFMNNELIKKILTDEGKDSLPITLVDGKVVLKGKYPDFEKLMKEVL